MFNETVEKSRRQFTVPLELHSRTHSPDTPHNRLELEVIIGKVEERKWRLIKTYTTEKIVAVATGVLYQKPPEGSEKEMHIQTLTGGRDPPWTQEEAFRDFTEVEVEDSERQAVLDAVRKLSEKVYENKSKIFGIDPQRVFTQIMLGFIIGDEPPAPAPPPHRDPLDSLRREIQSDYVESSNEDTLPSATP